MLAQVMTMAEAKKAFQLGILKAFRVERAIGLITVSFDVLVNGERSRAVLVDARSRNSARQFKTLDAAVSALEQIGFAVVVLGGQ